LADLSARLIKAQMPAVKELDGTDSASLAEAEELARKLAASRGFDPQHYVATERRRFVAYDPEQEGGVLVRVAGGETRELATVSPAARALVSQGRKRVWLVFPHELQGELEQALPAHLSTPLSPVSV